MKTKGVFCAVVGKSAQEYQNKWVREVSRDSWLVTGGQRGGAAAIHGALYYKSTQHARDKWKISSLNRASVR
jgi:hypothetical protein